MSSNVAEQASRTPTAAELPLSVALHGVSVRQALRKLGREDARRSTPAAREAAAAALVPSAFLLDVALSCQE